MRPACFSPFPNTRSAYPERSRTLWIGRSAASSLYLKPITVLKVSPPGRGACVREGLSLALQAHGAHVVHCSVPVSRHDLDMHGEIDNARIVAELRTVVAELAERARTAAAA